MRTAAGEGERASKGELWTMTALVPILRRKARKEAAIPIGTAFEEWQYVKKCMEIHSLGAVPTVRGKGTSGFLFLASEPSFPVRNAPQETIEEPTRSDGG